MALNPTTLGAAIKAALCPNPDPETGIDPVSLAVDNAQLDAFCAAIASAVVAHIVANAVVSGTIVGVSAPDISGGAVTGTCSGTVS
jgi:hypothetical protein